VWEWEREAGDGEQDRDRVVLIGERAVREEDEPGWGDIRRRFGFGPGVGLRLRLPLRERERSSDAFWSASSSALYLALSLRRSWVSRSSEGVEDRGFRDLSSEGSSSGSGSVSDLERLLLLCRGDAERLR